MSVICLHEVVAEEKRLADIRKEAENGRSGAYAEYDEDRYDLLIDVVETIARDGDIGAGELAQAALGQLPPNEDGKVFDDIEITEFQIDPQTEYMPERTQPLYSLDDDAQFEDAKGRLFTKIGHGPVQGSVEVLSADKISAYLDVGLYVRERKQ